MVFFSVAIYTEYDLVGKAEKVFGEVKCISRYSYLKTREGASSFCSLSSLFIQIQIHTVVIINRLQQVAKAD